MAKASGNAPAARRRLVLQGRDLRAHAAKLFQSLEKSDGARQEFVRNPVGLLAREVLKQPLAPQYESDANRLLMSVLSNKKFSAWLRRYPAERDGKPVPREQFQRDFASALIKYGDPVIVNSALKNVANGFDLTGLGPVAEQLIIGPEKSVATPAATPSTSDQSAKSSQNFNGLSFVDNDLIEPTQLRALVRQIMARAKDLREAGELADLSAGIR
jgi:hypothetical protein